eukprot:TRINITY_DN57423_c0_g1_i1.p1 TRINITY_DN57423_c0_g1~~TRINITY_DN57423_c0_g1_i1.p1  ORF type:complete len:209 (+),score=24.22 TRINITY_DN57423_c0_g1_i1:86-712(+)
MRCTLQSPRLPCTTPSSSLPRLSSDNTMPLWRLALVVWWATPLCNAVGDNGASQLANHVTETVLAGDIGGALAAFDQMSLRRGFGMHLGTQKGELIESAVAQGLPTGTGAGIVLETGCHAGDGTLRAILPMVSRAGSIIVSTEANSKWLASAERIVAHATRGLDIEFVPVELAEDSAFDKFLEMLREKRGIKQFTTVIFDQDQTRFAS